MNNYHENHSDSEIRKKYQEWFKAYHNYKARAMGFKTAEALKEHQEADKKPSILEMLKAIGQSAIRGVSTTKAKTSKASRGKKQNIRKSSGMRGS